MSDNCITRTLMGFAMGATAGAGVGVLFGGYAGYRYGLRGRDLILSVGKTAAQSGGTFGFFLAIGSAIRCDDGSSSPYIRQLRLEQRRAQPHTSEQHK